LPNQIDYDVTCKFRVCTDLLPDGFYAGMNPAEKDEVQQKIVDHVEAEMVMFAHDGPDGHQTLLPGWADLDGNSVLLNGTPINGRVGGALTYSPLGISPPVGTCVRVTGPLVIDKGHPQRQLEIHPVYAMDIIEVGGWDDITGVWGDTDGLSYYLHLVGHHVWVFITAPFHRDDVLAVFQGLRNGNMIAGQWSTLPWTPDDSGEMGFTVAPSRTEMVVTGQSPLSGRSLRKLYDVSGHPCADLGDLRIVPYVSGCAGLGAEVEGAVVRYVVENSQLAAMQGLTFAWSTTAGVAVHGTDGATFEVSGLPAAGTHMTIGLDITSAEGCVHHGERALVTLSVAEAASRVAWCEALRRMFTLAGMHRSRVPPGDPAAWPSEALVQQTLTLATQLTRYSQAVLDHLGRRPGSP
jgi:hypothetical protein